MSYVLLTQLAPSAPSRVLVTLHRCFCLRVRQVHLTAGLVQVMAPVAAKEARHVTVEPSVSAER